VLRGVAVGLSERLGPEDLVFAVMDIRGEVARAVPQRHLGGHAGTPVAARQLAESVAAELARRAADPTATEPGPRIVVLADDYDMLASGGTEPLAPLIPYLPSARDLRLHVVLSRPVAGSSRAMYDVALQTVRDTGGSCLVMSGERSEGPILPRVYAERMPAGRGWFVRRGEPPHIVQAANFHAVPRAA